MKNHKIFNKVRYLIIILMFTLIFRNRAYANLQNPVKFIQMDRLDSVISEGIAVPSVKVSWEPDTSSTLPDDTSGIIDKDEIHEITHYEIYLQCISDNESSMKRQAIVPATTHEYEFKTLKSGSIYKVAIRPIHYHKYMDGDELKNDRLAAQEKEDTSKIFMTDPSVEVTSEGTDLIVKFDDAGTWVNYRIYYEAKTQGVPFQDGIDPDGGIFVDRTSENATTIVEGGRSKLVYRVTGKSDIRAGKAYSIAVVPYDVTTDDYGITINNDATNINVFTCATEAPFAINEESEEYIKLSWEGLGGNSDIKKITIYSGKGDNNFEIYAVLKNSSVENIYYYLVDKPSTETKYYIEVEYEDDDVKAVSKVLTYNPSLISITPGKPNLTISNTNGEIKLNWTAFYYNGAIDYDVYYDIVLTDEVAVVYDDNLFLESNYIVGENTQEGIKIAETGLYTRIYDEYLTTVRDSSGLIKGYTVSKIKENTVYYAKVVGKVKTNSGFLQSEPAIISFYVLTSGKLYMPPVMAKPPLAKKGVTDSTISLKWLKKWNEVTKKGATSNIEWATKVWYYANGNEFYFNEQDVKDAALAKGVSVEEFEYYDISSNETLKKFKMLLSSINKLDDYIFREVEFYDEIKYEGYIVDYLSVEEYIKNKQKIAPYDIRDYIKEYESNKDLWKELTVLEDMLDTKANTLYTTFSNLQSNMTYFMMIRAYRIDENGNKIYATTASSIIATTTLPQENIEPVPTVPSLLLHEVQDISAIIKWEYNSLLSYEIRYGKEEDKEKATKIDITNEMINQIDAPKDGKYYLLNVVDLFPETGYYFWIKAKQVTGTEESAWSNALMFVTLEVQPNPITPPSGIGLASIEDPDGQDYLTIEWTRTDEDIELDSYKGIKVKKNISYILEIANNIKFLDAKAVEAGNTSGNGNNGSDFIVMDKTMVKALNLSSNTRYYVRVKTKITVTEEGEQNKIEKESSWSIIKIFRTKSVNEYDSEYGEIEMPLADKIETIYSNNVVRINILNDERVINEMIELGTFDYIFDFSNEKEKYATREAYVPINVLKALQNRDMNIILKLKDMSLNINAKALENGDYARLARSGGVNGVMFFIKDDNSIYDIDVESKEVGISFDTKYGGVSTIYLEDYMDVQFDVTNATYFKKTDPYGVVYNAKTRTWERAKDEYLLGYDLIFKTGKTGKIGIAY